MGYCCAQSSPIWLTGIRNQGLATRHHTKKHKPRQDLSELFFLCLRKYLCFSKAVAGMFLLKRQATFSLTPRDLPLRVSVFSKWHRTQTGDRRSCTRRTRALTCWQAPARLHWERTSRAAAEDKGKCWSTISPYLWVLKVFVEANCRGAFPCTNNSSTLN